jgi:hypothetical protein
VGQPGGERWIVEDRLGVSGVLGGIATLDWRSAAFAFSGAAAAVAAARLRP